MSVELSVRSQAGEVLPCVVTTSSSGDKRVVHVVLDDGRHFAATGGDFEDALVELRGRLEAAGLVLLCNRFRRNAFTTSMSRQMSDGLSCYLVRARRPVGPSAIAACLDPAPNEDVVSQVEADLYIEHWKSWFERPVPLRWLGRLWPSG